MRNLLVFICFLLIGISATLAVFVYDTERHADRWNERITSLARVEQLNADVSRSQYYSGQLMEAAKSLALENGLLCERDAKMVQVVSEFEIENRALKESLAEAVGMLEEQSDQIDALLDENAELEYKNESLRNQVETLESAIDKLKAAIDALQPVEPIEPAEPDACQEEDWEVASGVS